MTYDKVCCLRDNIFKVEKIVEMADEKNKKLLIQYFSYQYGTLLKNIAFLQSRNQRRKICKDIRRLHKLLIYSSNIKIKMLRLTEKICGIDGTVEILHLIEYLK